jgi:DNA-binding transcriptional LysR family regulator
MSNMQDMHLASLDLNLIVALDALLAERSVTKAAERIGITQSAMSHALARLRLVTQDELLVRAAGGMVPTPRALALASPIRHALGEVAAALHVPEAFDPRSAKLRVVLATSDYGELVVLPELVRRLGIDAPGIELRVVAHTDDAPEKLTSGAVDLVVAPRTPRDGAAGMFAHKLFDESFVCVVRRGHPLAKKKLTLARFAEASHALIAPRGREGGFVDDALAALGLSRHVAVAVPHFLIAPHLVATSDLILTLASRVARVLARPLGLIILAPPPEIRLERFTMSLLWHERTQGDPGHAWVRGLFAQTAKHASKEP